MIAGIIIGLVIIMLTALVMIGIGISQLKSKTPVAFYTGEKPLRKEELSDVSMWNKRHGIMWITYGIVMILSYLIAVIIGLDSRPGFLLFCGGIVLPILVMIWYHHKLIRIYKLPKGKVS